MRQYYIEFHSRASDFIKSTAIAVIAVTCTGITSMAIPADPEARVVVQQPGGANLTIRPAGDEFTGRFETLDGYTVVRSRDGSYVFATADATGRLVPSTLVASDPENRTIADEQVLQGMAKSVVPSNLRLLPRLSADEITSIRSLKDANAMRNVLVILISFTDVSPVYQVGDFENLMNEPGYGTYGSVRDFYLENSYGQYDLTGTVVGWYTALRGHSFYGYNDDDNWQASAQLAREAILAADAAGVDFAPFDNDNNGKVDGVFIVHAGPGAEAGYDDYPWSHSWSLSDAGLSVVHVDGKTLNNYTMQPEKHTSTQMVRIGVFCHEYGHAIGLPDLYDTDGSSIGIGNWCLMAGGSWNGGGASPSHFSAWCKSRLGWLTPINVDTNVTNLLITDVETNPLVYRLWRQGLGGPEYFLIEYRRRILFDATLPGCGLAIWHIDQTRQNNEDDSRRLVDLVEADRSENSSAGDMWLNKTFDSLTNPNSDSYTSGATSVSVIVTTTSCSVAGLNVHVGVGVEPGPPPCCQGIRGNVDSDPDDVISISDLTELVNYMFKGGQIDCSEEANIDGSTEINISDLTALVNYSFKSGAQPALCP